jgi:hypothetical protein
MMAGDPASPEKLRDYSEHQAATCARRDLICPPLTLAPAQACALTRSPLVDVFQTTFRVRLGASSPPPSPPVF